MAMDDPDYWGGNTDEDDAEPTYDPAAGKIVTVGEERDDGLHDVTVDTDGDGIADGGTLTASAEQLVPENYVGPDVNAGATDGPQTEYLPPEEYDDDAKPVESTISGPFAGATVMVDVKGFRAFLDSLAEIPTMLTGDSGLELVRLEPGTLPGGDALQAGLDGPSGTFTKSCILSLQDFRRRLVELHEDLSEVLLSYEQGQDQIELSAKGLDAVFQEALTGTSSAGAPPLVPASGDATA